MDKTKFTINPHLDSEGFPVGNEELDHRMNYFLRLCGFGYMLDGSQGPWVTPRSLHDVSAALLKHGAVTLHAGEYAVVRNPPGWNEPGMQPITWADENPDTTSVEVKRATAEALLAPVLKDPRVAALSARVRATLKTLGRS